MAESASTANKAELERFLSERGVNRILSRIVEALCDSRPENIVMFMVEHLMEQYEDRIDFNSLLRYVSKHAQAENANMTDSSATESERSSAAEEPPKVKVSGSKPPPGPTLEVPLVGVTKGTDMASSSPSMEVRIVSDEDDMLRRRRFSLRGRRAGVSAPPIPPPPANFRPPVIPKSEEQKKQLKAAMAENILFSHLDPEQLSVLFDAMEAETYQPGDTIIRQGDEGNHFYVLEFGQCDIFVDDKSGADPKKVMTVGRGQSFGELALMYGTPRAATVKAMTDVRCWVMDRDTYRCILMDTMLRKRKLYTSFLKKVPILQPLQEYELDLISDALEPQSFEDGECIVRQGDTGNVFFIVEKGSVSVWKSADGGEEKYLSDLGESNFFGEIALLTNQPRQATVKAKGMVRVLKLNRKAFERLLGPVEDILRRNMESYNLYLGKTV